MSGVKSTPNVQGNIYGTLSVHTENEGDNHTRPMSSRSTQKMSSYTARPSSSSNLSSPLSNAGVTNDFPHSNNNLPRIGSASSHSKAISSKISHPSSSGTKSKLRPGTAMGSNVDSERRGLKSSQHFSEGDNTMDYTARRTHVSGLQAIPEGKFMYRLITFG